jgi:hypothetical protein
VIDRVSRNGTIMAVTIKNEREDNPGKRIVHCVSRNLSSDSRLK